MSFYLRVSLLVLCLTSASEVSFAGEGSMSFWIFPIESCHEMNDKNMKNGKNLQASPLKETAISTKVCSWKTPSIISFTRALVNTTNMGQIINLSPTMTPEEDSIELVCYRCAFGKIEKEECGRFKNIHKKEDKAKGCPNT